MSKEARCDCGELPFAIKIERVSSSWLRQLKLVDHKPWLTLRRCPDCGQLWQLDVIDRLQTNLGIKIASTSGWKNYDDTAIRLQFLVNSRGGLSDEICIMQGCKNNALLTLAYCPGHAYFYVGLRE